MAWLALLMSLVLGVALLQGCTGSPTGSPSAMTSATPTVSAPASPGVIGRVPPCGLVADAIVEVVVDGLRARTAPSVDDAVSTKLEPLLERGIELFIVDGPVAADGYDWYLVKAIHWHHFGWVAVASRTGEAWIEDGLETKCPVLPDDARQLGVTTEEVLVHRSELTLELDANVYCVESGGQVATTQLDPGASLRQPLG